MRSIFIKGFCNFYQSNILLKTFSIKKTKKILTFNLITNYTCKNKIPPLKWNEIVMCLCIVIDICNGELEIMWISFNPLLIVSPLSVLLFILVDHALFILSTSHEFCVAYPFWLKGFNNSWDLKWALIFTTRLEISWRLRGSI